MGLNNILNHKLKKTKGGRRRPKNLDLKLSVDVENQRGESNNRLRRSRFFVGFYIIRRRGPNFYLSRSRLARTSSMRSMDSSVDATTRRCSTPASKSLENRWSL